MLFIALLVVSALARPIVDLELIKEINAPNSGATWVAGVNEKFLGMDIQEAKNFLGVIPSRHLSAGMKTISSGRNDLPDEYDASKEHPGCIVAIRDQKQCGSCWAFGCSETLSDRFNIKDSTCAPDTQVLLSPQDLVSCDKQQQGCNGGWPIKAWAYTNQTGLTFDVCDPYTSGGGQTGVCKVKPGGQCPGSKKKAVFYHTGEGYRILGEEAMATDIYEKGPIEVVFEVYNDFFNYKSGVYHHVSGGLAGYHAVKMIGWGIDKKAGPYWIVYNSWGTGWGEKGVFRIKKGSNECKIEKPDDDKPDLCNSAAEATEITFA